MNNENSQQRADGHHISQADRGGVSIVGDQNVIITDSGHRVPLQVPSRHERFTNREDELSNLLANLQPGRTVTLCGPGGIGKSAIAAEAIWKLTSGKHLPDLFPDGVIWHDFYREPETAKGLEHIALSFGEEPKPTPRDAVQRALAERTALLLLDGTEDTDNLSTLLDITGNCGVIVTSRKRQDARSERQDIESLHIDKAVILFQEWAEGEKEDDQIIRRICELVGCLPLAVRLAGRYLCQTGESSSEYLDWLEESPLEALNHGKRKLDSVPLLIKRSLDRVSEPACKILSVCGILAYSPFSKDVLAAAFPELPVRNSLSELILYGLVNRSGDRFELTHALIHTYARMHLKPDDEVIKRIAVYYETFVREQNELDAAGFRNIDPERTHIIAVLCGCPDYQAGLNLLWSIRDYCMFGGYWTDFRIAVEYGISASCNLKNRSEEANCIKALGDVHRMLSEYEEARARYEEARPIFNQIGDRLGEANCIQALGDVHMSLSEYEEARARYEEARPIYNQIGDRYSYAATLADIGLAYKGLKDMAQACKHLRQSISLFEQIKVPAADTVKGWLADIELDNSE